MGKKTTACILLIITLSSIAIFYNLHKGNLANWDEAIYAEVSKETLQTHDWATLHYEFHPWFHKSPFLLYLLSVIYKMFGISTFTSRLLPALFGIGTILATFFLAKELFNQKTAFMSSLILITTPQFIHYSRMLMLDMPVTFFIVFSIYLFVLSEKRNSTFIYCLLGISLGLGVMAKGAIGSVAFFIVFASLALTKNIKYFTNRNFLIILLAFIIITLPWHLIQLILHKSKFINDYLGYHVLKRIAVPLEAHDYGNIFYFRVLKYGLKTWLWPLILSIVYLLIFEIKRNKEKILLISWIAITFGIFLIAKTKLPWYLIPLYPGFAIITAHFLDNINVKKVKAGFIACIIIFIFSFHLPKSCYGNNGLYNINLIAGFEPRVHNSISDNPGKLFYLGVKRYSDDELLKEDAFYVAGYRAYYEKFSNYKIVHAEDGYVLFAKNNAEITKALSKIPDEMRMAPLSYCQPYMPANLGRFK